MSSPPFRLASTAVPAGMRAPWCCDTHAEGADISQKPVAHARMRLNQLSPYFHCSVIGTCLSTAELRKLVARHYELDVHASDQEVHSIAVGLAETASEATKALHKALDRRHAAAIAASARVCDDAALGRLWSQALDRGEVPGAYWALLTHWATGDALRNKAFGDVHMLSHLVGASNRADIRRLAALERDNADLVDRGERQQARLQSLVDERDSLIEALRLERLSKIDLQLTCIPPEATQDPVLARQVALRTERREEAEQRALSARAEADRVTLTLAEMQAHADALARELRAAESALQQLAEQDSTPTPRLAGRRVAYIGGRPSSTPAIRALVQRYGGRFAHHDGGLEDRKGLLSATIVGADLVAFPMDCIDHDSMHMIKRLCARHGVAFLPLRTASATSLMSALAAEDGTGGAAQGGPICLKHG